MTIGSDAVVAMIAPWLFVIASEAESKTAKPSNPAGSPRRCAPRDDGADVAAHIRASGSEFKSLQTAVTLIASGVE
jgi:hypothetical protein